MKKRLMLLMISLLCLMTLQGNVNVNADESPFTPETDNHTNTGQDKDGDYLGLLTPQELAEMRLTDKNGKEFDELLLEDSQVSLQNTSIESKRLSFTVSDHGQKQINSSYCGPASARAVIKFLTGKNYTQSYIAPLVGFDGSGTPWQTMGSGINKVENLGYGWSNINTANRDIRTVVRRSINDNRPVIAYVGLPELDPSYYGPNGVNFNSAHYIVIIGYSFGYTNVEPYSIGVDTTAQPQAKEDYITYYDPYRHQIITTTYTRIYNAMKACQQVNQVLIW